MIARRVRLTAAAIAAIVAGTAGFLAAPVGAGEERPAAERHQQHEQHDAGRSEIFGDLFAGHDRH